jgi:hypothetical protein
MKDFDELLYKNPPTPKRDLKANFVTSIVAELRAAPEKQSLWQKLQAALHVPHLGKIGALAFGGIILTGGTVAAITLWPTPTVTPTLVKKLPSGNRIVSYDTQNCDYLRATEGSKTTSQKAYYEIRENSKLTDQQIADSLRGYCESLQNNQAIHEATKRATKDMYSTPSGLPSTITAISKDSITLTPDTRLNLDLYTIKPNLTYKRFDSNLVVYNQNAKISYGDLKVGDTVMMAARSFTGKSTETIENDNPLNHPEQVSILALVKIPALTGDSGTFDQAIASDMVRVEPCDNNETGFCRAYDFSSVNQ